MPKHSSEDFKESIVQKMLSPGFTSILCLAIETGMSCMTLTHWRDVNEVAGETIPKTTKKLIAVSK